ncbi:MAG: peptidylprolyl isomerase [Candidatus Falkowbacteria bacterium]
MARSIDGVKKINKPAKSDVSSSEYIQLDSVIQAPPKPREFFGAQQIRKVKSAVSGKVLGNNKGYSWLSRRKADKLKKKQERIINKENQEQTLIKSKTESEKTFVMFDEGKEILQEKEKRLKAKAYLKAEHLKAKQKKKNDARRTKENRVQEKLELKLNKYKELKQKKQEQTELKKIKKQELIELKKLQRQQKKEKITKVFHGYKSTLKKYSKKIVLGLGGLLIAMIVIIIVLSLIVYRLPHTAPAQLLIQNLPFPVALVNYQPILFSNYMEDKRLLSDYYQIIKEQSQVEKTTEDENNNAKDIILEKSIAKTLLKSLASHYNIHLTNQDLEYKFAQLAEEYGGEEDYLDIIYNDYGLTKEMFVDKIIYYQTLQEKIYQSFLTDEKVHKGASLRMAKVLKLVVRNKESFEELARKYSEDANSLRGGDIGYVKREYMSEIFQDTVIGLNIGEASGVIKENGIFYIVKLYDIKSSKTGEEYWFKKITINTNYTFEEYLKDLREQAKLIILLEL